MSRPPSSIFPGVASPAASQSVIPFQINAFGILGSRGMRFAMPFVPGIAAWAFDARCFWLPIHEGSCDMSARSSCSDLPAAVHCTGGSIAQRQRRPFDLHASASSLSLPPAVSAQTRFQAASPSPSATAHSAIARNSGSSLVLTFTTTATEQGSIAVLSLRRQAWSGLLDGIET